MATKRQREKQSKIEEEEQKKSEGWNWDQKGSCIFGDAGTVASEKIAGFDMDWTLIRTKSGKTFPQNANDWVLWDKQVIKKIQELYNDNFKIVIFSNQGGIGNGKQQAKDIKAKIQAISKEIGVPMQAFMSTQEDVYKKPSPGMWDLMAKQCNDGIKIDKKASMYVGDAAGRVPPQVVKKDFSDSDFKFSIACGVQFYTPEQIFLGQKQTVKPSGFDPKKFAKNTDLFKEKNAVLKLDKQEMIVFCGSSSTGKSTFTVNHLSDYERVNRDTLKTKEKCLKVAEEALKNKKSVVIDNTNPTAQDRALYINLAKKYSVPVRCFFFEAEKDMCFFLNEQRVTNTNRTHLSGKVPKIPIHSFFKNHEKPMVKEGFVTVQTVQFVPVTKGVKDEESFYVYGK